MKKNFKFFLFCSLNKSNFYIFFSSYFFVPIRSRGSPPSTPCRWLHHWRQGMGQWYKTRPHSLHWWDAVRCRRMGRSCVGQSGGKKWRISARCQILSVRAKERCVFTDFKTLQNSWFNLSDPKTRWLCVRVWGIHQCEGKWDKSPTV